MVVKEEEMLKDCLEIFKEKLNQTEKNNGNADSLILDQYIPADGDYLLIRRDGTIESCFVKLDKKTRALDKSYLNFKVYEEICFLDYYSRLVSMNKPQGAQKTIHSNNYLSFWVKWESLENGKLDEKTIDIYYDAIKTKKEKFKNTQERILHEYVEEQIPQIDQEELEYCREWIKQHIFSLDDYNLDLQKQNYLKIFFETDRERVIQESNRYLFVNIFNSNDYNLKLDGHIWGTPNDNFGLNAKKPYLQCKTKKIATPCLITLEEAIVQKKFFDYLMNAANIGETDIYFNYEEKKIDSYKKGELPKGDFSGFFISVQKGKELEIRYQDIIVDYTQFLKKPFLYRNIFTNKYYEDDLYKEYTSRADIQTVLDEVLFSKQLIKNYFTETDKISAEGVVKKNLIAFRNVIFSWIYQGNEVGVEETLKRVSLNMVKNSIFEGYWKRASQQINLFSSIKEYFGGVNMADKYGKIRVGLRNKINDSNENQIESDAEYGYAIGQLVSYFISLSKAQDKKCSLANPFLNTTDDIVIRRRLRQYFMKYNYQIATKSKRFSHLYTMIFGYNLEGKINTEDVIIGYLSDNLIYEK